ncbi:MAG: hypothetical protein KL787_10040 [Taibaiella sp.]|nr:hypothetical protein [Taibaiella sp.]
MPVAGDIIEVTCNHPTLGTFSFAPVAGEDSTYNPGGFITADENTAVNGRGESIDKLNRVRWSFEVLTSWDKRGQGEDKQISDLAASLDPGDWTFTNADGTVYAGKGKPVGDLNFNGNAGTFPLKVSGGGKLEIVK